MADQPVEVVDHDLAWAGLFAEQRDVLEELLRPWLSGRVEWLLHPRPEARTHHLQVMEGTDPHVWALLAFIARVLRQQGISPPERGLLPE